MFYDSPTKPYGVGASIIIDSGNGLSANRHQAITRTNIDSLSTMGHHKLLWYLNQIMGNHIHENEFENIVHIMKTILYQIECD